MTFKPFEVKFFYKRLEKQAAFLLSLTIMFGLLISPVSFPAQVESDPAETEESSEKDLQISTGEFFAAPYGSASGDGSINNPWDLKTALTRTQTVVPPGSTVWLRGGVYNVPTADLGFTSTLSGTSANPVMVASYPGEWATIDGNVTFSALKNKTILKINGSYVWFMNFEITNTETTNRKIDTTSSNPQGRRGNAIDDYAVGTKIINLVIHDAGQGIGTWASSRDTEYYGNVIYNNGWDAPDRRHGHGSYVQNETGTKILEDNIFFSNFSMNAQTGGSSAAYAYNLHWFGNTFFNAGMAWKGPNIRNFKVIGNNFYGSTLKIGDEINSTYESAEVRNNYAMGGVELFEFTTPMVFQNNTVWNIDPNGRDMILNYASNQPGSKFLIDNNAYYKAFTGFPYWHFKVNFRGTAGAVPASQYGDFAYDKTTGSQVTAYNYTGKSWTHNFPFDANSTYTDSAPTGLKVFVKPNRYDANRANVIIYNWDQANTVGVDASAVLNPGDTYELRNTQDYFGDVITGTYSGGNLQIPMTGRTRAKPIGYDQTTGWYHDPLKPNTFPVFGAFVLIRTNSVVAPNQAPAVNAGNNQTITLNSSANLSGTATDDGLPNPPGALSVSWSKVSGRGVVIFGDPNSLNTTAKFSISGNYVLRLRVSDGALTTEDTVTITVKKR